MNALTLLLAIHIHLGVPGPSTVVQKFLEQVERDNSSFVATHGHDYFLKFVDGQHPRATVLTCGDSRFHVHAISRDSDNDLFVVRNIGNQLQTSMGSVEYGVHHLKTPVLMIIGHVGCGAIDAAMSDYSTESLEIQRELNGLHLVLANTPHQNSANRAFELVLGNVHRQVELALRQFAAELAQGKLSVVGAVYDFRDELKHGEGRLLIVDVNGEKNEPGIQALIHGLAPRRPGAGQ